MPQGLVAAAEVELRAVRLVGVHALQLVVAHLWVVLAVPAHPPGCVYTDLVRHQPSFSGANAACTVSLSVEVAVICFVVYVCSLAALLPSTYASAAA